jgi:hypothetical protein
MGTTLMWRWSTCGSQQGAGTFLSHSHLQAQRCTTCSSHCHHLLQEQLRQDRQCQQQEQQHTHHQRQQQHLRKHNWKEQTALARVTWQQQ